MKKKVEKNTTQRLQFLDGIRGYTCLLVAFLHLGSLFFFRVGKVFGDTTQLGGYAPYLFFVLSGFSVALSLSKKDSFHFKSYLKRRLVTFIPIYYFLIIISFFIIRPSFPANNDIGGLFTHLTFTNFDFINPLWVRSLMDLEWTQPFMFWFYFIIPFVFILSRKSIYLRFLLLISAVLIYLPVAPHFPYHSIVEGIYDNFRHTFIFYVFAISLLLYAFEQKKSQTVLSSIVHSFPLYLILVFVLLFPTATIWERVLLSFYVIYSSIYYFLGKLKNKNFPKAVIVLGTGIANLGFVALILVTRRFIFEKVDIPLMLMLFVGTVIYISTIQSSFLSRFILENKAITFIGRISYPLFLVQLLVAYILNRNPQIAALSPWLNFGIILGCSIGVAYLIHNYDLVLQKILFGKEEDARRKTVRLYIIYAVGAVIIYTLSQEGFYIYLFLILIFEIYKATTEIKKAVSKR